MEPTLAGYELSPEQFEAIRTLVYDTSGISLHAGKEGLVRSRLARRVRALGLDGYGAYLERLGGAARAEELAELVDAMTTNKTSFFREPAHFDFLREQLLPTLRQGRPLRIWSAGCSTGEEPYSLAMLLREELPDLGRMDVRILATDVSRRVLAYAREGIYEAEAVRELPRERLLRHFQPVASPRDRRYTVAEPVRALVRFARLNLMGEWPMRGPFDVILCRNVMIYFDRPTQERLVRRFWALLPPGGHLLVGHSESLSAHVHPFRYVQPAVYVR